MSYEQPDHPPSDVGACTTDFELMLKVRDENVSLAAAIDRLTSDKARLAAELADCKKALVIIQDTSLAHAGKQNTRIVQLEAEVRRLSDVVAFADGLPITVHFSKGGRDPREKIYSALDAEAFVTIALAARGKVRSASETKANAVDQLENDYDGFVESLHTSNRKGDDRG